MLIAQCHDIVAHYSDVALFFFLSLLFNLAPLCCVLVPGCACVLSSLLFLFLCSAPRWFILDVIHIYYTSSSSGFISSVIVESGTKEA